MQKKLLNHIIFHLYKKRMKKQLIFEKRGDFENGKKWPLGKDYSFCKMVIFCQKIKRLKHAKNDAIIT